MSSQQSCLILWAPQAVNLKDWKLDQPLFCTFWKAWSYVSSFHGIRSCSCPSDGSVLCCGTVHCLCLFLLNPVFPQHTGGPPDFLLVWWWILFLINFAGSFSASGELLQLQVSLWAGHLLLFVLLVLLPKGWCLKPSQDILSWKGPPGIWAALYLCRTHQKCSASRIGKLFREKLILFDFSEENCCGFACAVGIVSPVSGGCWIRADGFLAVLG